MRGKVIWEGAKVAATNAGVAKNAVRVNWRQARNGKRARQNQQKCEGLNQFRRTKNGSVQCRAAIARNQTVRSATGWRVKRRQAVCQVCACVARRGNVGNVCGVPWCVNRNSNGKVRAAMPGAQNGKVYVRRRQVINRRSPASMWVCRPVSWLKVINVR